MLCSIAKRVAMQTSDVTHLYGQEAVRILNRSRKLATHFTPLLPMALFSMLKAQVR